MTDSPDGADLATEPAGTPDRKDANEAFRLRAAPPRVVRLSRKVLAGLAIIVCLGIGGALIFALQGRNDGVGPNELFTTENRPAADELRRLPSDYGSIPQLGPALPGDLGRPILRAQEEGRPVPATVVPGPDPEEQRRLAELEAARTSELFFSASSGGNRPASAATGIGLGGGLPAALPSEQRPSSAQERQSAFLGADVDRRTVSADRVAPPPSPYTLQAGTIIPAALVTGIRSDLPGQITAQVTENVYDSPSGRYLLIPQGARLVGEYDNGVGFGQRRMLLVWNRIILPGGRSIVLERQPGADAAGYAGLEDGVDYHWWDLAKAAALSTLLGIGAELATDDGDRLVGAIRDGAQDMVNDAGQQIVQRQLGIQPTLTIRPGFPVRVIVTRDLILEPQRGY
ncbi:conjugal transfer protein TraI [Erythrobacter sp. QSSC1-22B]|uniref:TrbI/VirB10 family protein n=1 Tax=Erythrobacter sp. QSSC1-22B TaxID=1860125 RepID=UPI000804E65E|nr:TrbI/VirB10 family protein [Erythrobacter sp. QSSC1-22B]OBX17721.1 conjugal transfer protein TraI [Erythrobacter sp. QSSC1-22B]